MHRDSKQRRQIMTAMAKRRTGVPKHPDQDALKKFREVPYQMRCGKEKKDADKQN